MTPIELTQRDALLAIKALMTHPYSGDNLPARRTPETPKTLKPKYKMETPDSQTTETVPVPLQRLVRPALPSTVPLYMAPVGLFDFEGTLCIRTEYSTNGRPDAYIIKSGEYFWGGARDPQEACLLQVMPLEVSLANVKGVPAAAGGTESTKKPCPPLGTTD